MLYSTSFRDENNVNLDVDNDDHFCTQFNVYLENKALIAYFSFL